MMKSKTDEPWIKMMIVETGSNNKLVSFMI